MIAKYFSPRKKTPEVLKLINKIGSEFEEEFVPIQPEIFAKNGFCNINVEEKITKDGGSIVYGWAIYQAQYLIEAELHAVWENTNGDLIDVTPSAIDTITEIMFIPDDRYNSMRWNSIRMNISKSKVVDTLIGMFELRNYLQNKYGVQLSNELDMKLPMEVVKILDTIAYKINLYQDYISVGVKSNMPCICKNKKSYNNCHANITLKELKKLVEEFENKRP